MSESITDRPLLTLAQERDVEDHVRRRMCAQRCELMERVLECVGFSRNTSYWTVALLLTRLSDGWRPVVRSLDRLAADRALSIAGATPMNQKRSFRRALAELVEYGILTVDYSDGEKRRRTRPASLVTVTINCRGLESILRDADSATDNATDRPRTTERTARRTDPGQRDGQTAEHSICTTLVPNSPSFPSPSVKIEEEEEQVCENREGPADELCKSAALDELAGRYVNQGVYSAPDVIVDRLRAGVPLDYFDALWHYWSPASKQIGAGALYRRLTISSAQLPVERGWPAELDAILRAAHRPGPELSTRGDALTGQQQREESLRYRIKRQFINQHGRPPDDQELDKQLAIARGEVPQESNGN